MKFCRRCQWTKEMFDKELLKLEEYIERIPEEERVSDEEYERRLMLCDTCSFMRGGMCGRCGWLLQTNVLLRDCPDVHKKW